MTYFDKISTTWSDRYRGNRHFRKRLETALTWLGADSLQLQLLDFGCGSGVLVGELLALGHNVYGVDSSAGMIEQSKQKFEQNPLATLELLTSNDFSGEYLQRTFDGIFCLGVIEYVDDAELLLKRLASVIKPNGFLVISVPNQGSLLRRVEKFIHDRRRFFRYIARFKYLTDKENYLQFQKHQFTRKSLNRLSETYGLVPREYSYQVAPHLMNSVAGQAAIGMTLFVKYRKTEESSTAG